MRKTLTGKVALVTGGSRGLGAVIADTLAVEGAHVAISYAASAFCGSLQAGQDVVSVAL